MKLNLAGRFLLPTLTILILGMGGSSWLTQYYSEKAVMQVVGDQSRQVVGSLSDLIAMWIEEAQVDLKVQAENPELQEFLAGVGDEQSVNAVLDHVKSLYADFDAVKLTNAQGLVIAGTNADEIGRLNAGERDYFQGAMRGDVAVSGALRSMYTGNLVFVVAAPVRVNGRISGTLLATMKLSEFSEAFVEPVSIAKEGYAFIVDKQGEIMAHKNSDKIMAVISGNDWGQKMLSEGTGSLRYEDDGEWKEVVFQREPTTGWIVAVEAHVHDIYEPAYELVTITRIISVVVALLVGGVIWLIVRPIVGNIRESVNYAAAVADGDFNRELHVQRSDEIGVLANALRSMVGNLKEMVATAEGKTAEAEEQTRKANDAMKEAEEARLAAEAAKREGMLQAAGQLEHIVLALSSAAEELSAQVDEASRGSEIQRARTAEAATAIEEMNATVLEVARNAARAADSAEDARKDAEVGFGVVGTVIEAISEVNSRAEALKEGLHGLGVHAEGIGRIMTVITDIADQTNLLALNAAIEAARAGDAGRGFAVVADEVRKLAEKTMQATKEVGDAIKAIQQGARDNIVNMDSAGEAVVRSTELAGRAGDSLEAIQGVAVSTADQVRSIATASEQQSAASEQIARSAEEINRIAGETSQVMVESGKAVNEVARMAHTLQSIVEQLKQA
ncbi:MAG: methyl-accepting chemotaxis protein [Halodesulfovibrio sp.]